MHIRFRGRTNNDNNNPIEKIVPAEKLGVQYYNNRNYFAEVYYSGKEFRTYKISKEEYERIGKLLEKNK